MAGYFLHVKTFSRGKGSSATRAAAYRSGERIRDERSGTVHDHTDRTDVAHAEIVLPAEYAGRVDMQWALNRSVLWNAVQKSGRNWNSRLAREVLVHVPPEIPQAQRIALVRRLSHELADRYHCAVDFAIHKARAQVDQRHHHAHILMTSRQVGPEGLGARTSLELSGTERHVRGLGPSKDELLWLRERWAQVANEALREAGLAVRLDHRSYKDQGLDREPAPRIPQHILHAERLSGRSTPAGDDIRARHRERVEARLKGPEDLARVLERQREENRQRAAQWRKSPDVEKTIPRGAMTREQLKAQRREYCKAHAAQINLKKREWRRANKEEVNRQQREFRKLRAERKAAEHSVHQEQQQIAAPAGASMSGERQPVSPEKPSSAVSAEQSLKNWLAYRENQRRLPATESPNQGLVFRESQARSEAAKSRSMEDGKRDREDEAGYAQHGRNNGLAL